MKQYRRWMFSLLVMAVMGFATSASANARTPIFIPDGPDIVAAASIAQVTPVTAALTPGNVWVVALAYEIYSATGSVQIADIPSAATIHAGVPAKMEFTGLTAASKSIQFNFPVKFNRGLVARLQDAKVQVYVIPEARRRALPMSY